MSRTRGDEPDSRGVDPARELLHRLTGGAVPRATSPPNVTGALGSFSDALNRAPLLIGAARLIHAPPAGVAPPVFVERRDDFLCLMFQFVNLGLLPPAKDGSTALVPIQGKTMKDARLVVYFQAQSFIELAFKEELFNSSFALPFIPSVSSGPSCLVFAVPPAWKQIPYTLSSLLDWRRLELIVAPSATLPEKPPWAVESQAVESGAQQVMTLIEAPARVFISPHQYAGWAHASLPVTNKGMTELWHTRLGVRSGSLLVAPRVREDAAEFQTARVLGSVPMTPTGNQDLLAMSNDQCAQLAKLTKATNIKGFEPQPLRVEQLMLSSLGAWLKVRGDWKLEQSVIDKTGLSVESWTHHAAMGRDHYVRVVSVGYLYPFGHRAAKIEVSERKFRPFPPGSTTGSLGAYLGKKMFVVVQEAEKTYGSGSKTGRAMPFKRVRITNTVMPELTLSSGPLPLLTKDGGKPYLFNLVAKDADGQTAEFTSPLIFVDVSTAKSPPPTLLNQKIECPLNGQKVAFAESMPAKPGDTTLETSLLTFKAVKVENAFPGFHPVLTEARVRIVAYEQLTGVPMGAVAIGYSDTYLIHGFGKDNKGQVFAGVILTAPVSNQPCPPEKAGGLATPNMKVAGLARGVGVVSDSTGNAENFALGGFNPKSYFDSSAKLLGGINLADIIAPTAEAPSLLTRTVYNLKGGKEDPSAGPAGAETVLEWSPAVKSAGAFKADDETTFHLTSRTATLAGAAEYSVSGELTNFTLDLADIIAVRFKLLAFKAGRDRKLDFTADLSVVEFRGPLAFLNGLSELIAKTGIAGGPFLDVTAAGVRTGFTLPLPAVAVGVMSLENVSLSAALNLPFDGRPVRARFDFSERHRPFHLIVYGIGGGGFLGVAVGLDGVETVEAALEFGGSIALNIGVAAGSVTIMAGIYFKVERKEVKGNPVDEVALTGYIRATGEMEVLGLICISVEFYLGLTYEPATNRVYGDAVLIVEVEVLFFSESVELPMHREFKNSKRFKFADVLVAGDWADYCDAFAA